MAGKQKVDQFERAERAWTILVKLAEERRSITYGELAEIMGVHPRVCRYFLGLIQDHCSKRSLPPLQSLVVNKRTGLPGGGYTGSPRDHHQIENAQNKVYDYQWKKIKNPF